MNKSRIEARYNALYQQFTDHLRIPLYRNGYALTLSSLVSSGLGMVYWILAAHRYSAREIGINSALISSMMFLAGVSELNLMSALIRFLPTAGRSSKRFVTFAYLISMSLSVVISFIFIKWVPDWTRELHFLETNSFLTVSFIFSTMIWSIFVLQDSVLTGLRRATWVLVENTVFSLAKIGLMLVFATAIPTLGIFASWSLAVLVAVLPTNYFIFQKLIPQHVRSEAQANGDIEPRQVIRFAAADYLGALSWLVITTLLPLVVTAVAGAQANAYFYLSWTIANALYMISSSMGASLVVEAAKDQHKLGTYSYQVFRNMSKIVIPVAGILAIAAPYVLMVFGRGYSSQGANLLRLLVISGLPNIINAIFVSVARVQRRTGAVVATLGSLAVLVLSLSYIFLKLYGIVGVGIGWLVAQSIVAGVVYITQLRGLWADTRPGDPGARLSLVREKRSSTLYLTLYRLAARLGLLFALKAVKKEWSTWRNRSKVNALLPELIRELPKELFDPAKDYLHINHVAHTVTDTTVALLGSLGEPPNLVLKLPGSDEDAQSQVKQSHMLAALYSDDRLDGWQRLLPVVLAEGKVGEHSFFIERALPGVTIQNFLHEPVSRQRVINLAAAEIGVFHQKTARNVVIDSGILQRWVNEPLSSVKQLASVGAVRAGYQETINRLAVNLSGALEGRHAWVSWIHGDFSPPNILADETGSEITGIVDWDLARPDDLPLLDLVHLFLSVRMALSQQEMGHIVCDLLLKKDWTPEEQLLIQASQSRFPGSPVDINTLLILGWLRHVSANLSKTSRYNHHNVWITENVVTVLETIDLLNTTLQINVDRE